MKTRLFTIVLLALTMTLTACASHNTVSEGDDSKLMLKCYLHTAHQNTTARLTEIWRG